MTTQFWSSVMDQNTDVTFRVWGLEMNTKLAAAGLVQTADTGQINWVTATRAAINTDAGYEIWQFNDAMQATAPIFLKIHYGSGSATNVPRLRIIVGTTTNGAGTLGGAVTTVRTFTASNLTTTGLIAYPSYLCVTSGFFGLIWKAGGSVAGGGSGEYAMAGLIICRSCDVDGVPDARGCFILYHSNSGNSSTDCALQSIRFTATAVVYAQQATDQPIFVPGNVTSSLVGTDFQAYLGWMINPQVLPVFGICGVFNTELGLGLTLSVTLIGSAAHTYIQLMKEMGQAAENSSIGLCMLWE